MKKATLRIATMMAFAALLGACGGSPPPPPPGSMGPELVKGGAVFRYRSKEARTVNLVGDFNNWDATVDPMNDENGDGVWTLFYPLPPGSYTYKFVVDGKRWVPDPTNPLSEPDGFDSTNSIVLIPNNPSS